jgi:hypothetical protein
MVRRLQREQSEGHRPGLGTHLGFLDGHAAWWDSRELIAEFARRSRAGDDHPLGLYMVGPTSDDLTSGTDSPGTVHIDGPRGCNADTLTIW